MLCTSLVILFSGIVHVLSSDVDRNVSVPEGLFSYPKTISKVPITSEHTTHCFVSNLTTSLTNRSVLTIKKRYFGVETSKTLRLDKVVLKKRDAGLPAATSQPTRDELTSPAQNITEETTFAWSHTANTSASTTGSRIARLTSSTEASTQPTSTAAEITASSASAHDFSSTNSATGASTHDVSTTRIPHIPQRFAELLQLRDLDRETYNNFLVTIKCMNSQNTQSEPNILVAVNVEDINDNTPVFNKSSLKATIQADVGSQTIMQITATDRDIGLNAKLSFRGIRGTQRNWWPNGSRQDTGNMMNNLILVEPAGSVYLFQPDLVPAMSFTFSVVVKDRAGWSTGNRATATATIEVCCAEPTAEPPSARESKLEWWMIAVPVLGVIVFFVMAVAFKKLRNKQKNRRSVLVIDDEFLLATDGSSPT